jgi:hypothetical protein
MTRQEFFMVDKQHVNAPANLTELQDAASRVTQSATFSRSPRLREFLSFVIRCSVEDRSHEVNEYSIGVQVFGKHPNYNPNQDNIVRVTARQLRSKLTEYYSKEGILDPWKIEIPKGCYQATLLPNPPAEPLKEGLPPVTPRRITPLLAAISVLCIAGWVVAAWLQFRIPTGPSRPAYLLASILTDQTLPTTIVLDDPVLGRAWWRISAEMDLNGFVNERYLDTKYYSTDRDQYLLGMLERNHYVEFLSLQTAERLADIARSYRVESVVMSCRSLRPEQLKRGNFILIGGVSSNPWVSEIQKNLAFEHVIDRTGGRRLFVNRHPRPGEPAAFETPATKQNPGEHYFTRVAVLNNPYGSGKIALLGGTSRETAEAATQFALSQTGVDRVRQICGSPVEKLAGFELILETKSVAGADLTRHVVASRCSPQ